MKLPILLSLLVLQAGSIAAEDKATKVVVDSRPTRLENVRTTAYTHSESDHIKYGRKNAIGTRLRLDDDYSSAAADWSIFPLGTKFKMDGNGKTYVIDDYGSALVGKPTIDIYCPTRSAMNKWGVRHVNIEIVEFGDYEKSREILEERKKWRHCRAMLASINKMDTLPPAGVPMSPQQQQEKLPEPEVMLANVAPETKPKIEVSREPDAPAPVSKPATAPEPVLVAAAAPSTVTPEGMPPVPDPEVFLANLNVSTATEPAKEAQQTPASIELASFTPSITKREIRPLTREEATERVAYRQRNFVPIAAPTAL